MSYCISTTLAKMKFYMFTIINKQLQIFRSIVLYILNRTNRKFNTFMMYNFFRFKIASKVFFHNKAMFSNISKSIIMRVISCTNKNISTFICKAMFSMLKHITFFIFIPWNTALSFYRPFFPSFKRMFFSKKIFITYFRFPYFYSRFYRMMKTYMGFLIAFSGTKNRFLGCEFMKSFFTLFTNKFHRYIVTLNLRCVN